MSLLPALGLAGPAILEHFDQAALDLDRWHVWKPGMFQLQPERGIVFDPAGDTGTRSLRLNRMTWPKSFAVRFRMLGYEHQAGHCYLSASRPLNHQLKIIAQRGGFVVLRYRGGKQTWRQYVRHALSDGRWAELRVTWPDAATVVVSNGETELARTEVPEQVRGRPARVGVYFYRAKVEIAKVELDGRVVRSARQRIGTPIAETNYSDPTKHRHYPRGVVEIHRPADGVDLEPAAQLPAVERWLVGKPDFDHGEFTPQTEFPGKRNFDFRVGVDDERAVPTRIRWFEKKRTPEEGRFYFNLARDGVYTLRLYFAGAKNLGNLVTVKLDGHLLYRDLLRGPNPKALHSWFREHIPVKLRAGPHVLSIRADLQQARLLSHMMSVYFDAIGLEPGRIPLVYGIDATEPRPVGERSASVQGSRTLGRDFHYRLRKLPTGALDVELLFHEAVTGTEGFRRFDVEANGKPVLTDYDIAADVGPDRLAAKRFRLEARDGTLDLHFVGKVGRAQVNMIRVHKEGQRLVEVNCGATPHASYGFMAPSDVPERKAVDPLPTDLFDGASNVVANPGLEAETPVWRPIEQTLPLLARSPVRGEGEMVIDDQVAHRGRRSLRLSTSRGAWGVRANTAIIDWTRPFRFSAWVKAKGATGQTRLVLEWLIPQGATRDGSRVRYNSQGNGVARGGVLPGPATSSEPVQGTLDWRPIHLEARPPRGAAAVTFMVRSDGNAGTVWLDDFACDGYGERPIEVIADLAGYQLGGSNNAVVLSRKAIPGAAFSLVELKSDNVVYQGRLREQGRYDYLGRYGYVADFGAHRETGWYVLRVETSAGGMASSLPFPIVNNRYLDLTRHMAFYFFVARCGQEVPGWHKACHLDDAIVQSSYYDRGSRVQQGRDLVGGWHDAGDYGKFNKRTWGPLYSLASLANDRSPKWRQYGGSVPDVISEVIWGADYTCKTHEGNGLFIGKVNGGFAGGHPAFPPSLETDGDPGTVDGLGRTAAWFCPATPMPAAALAAAARAVRPHDADRAERYLDAARTCFDNTTAYWDDNRGDHPADWRDLYFDPKAAMAAVELARATGDDSFLEDAEARVRRVLPLVEEKLFVKAPYCWSVRWPKGSLNTFHFDFLVAPLHFLRSWPDHPLASAIRRVCRRAIEEVILPTLAAKRTPFGQLTHLIYSDQWYYCTAYNTELYPQTAYLLALAANVLEQPSWLEPAEHNLQWMTGRNTLNVSYVSGLADRQATPWVGLIHVPGLQHGTIPGAIAKGICWGQGKVDWSGRHRPVGLGMPAGFSYVSVDTGDGHQPHFPATEIWEWFNHPTLMAAIELHKALAPRVTGEALPPLPLGTANLIRNSGFEETTDTAWINQHRPKWRVEGGVVPVHWDYNGDQAGVLEVVDDPVQARHGRRSLKVVKPDSHRSAMIHNRQPFFELKRDEVYWVSVWLRGRGRAQLWCHESEGPTAARYRYSRRLAEVVLQEAWDRIDVVYRVTGTTPRGEPITHGRFGLNLSPDTTAWIDDFEVRRVASPRLPRPEALP